MSVCDVEYDSFALGLNINLGRVAHTVTKALDYVGVDDHSHGRRVGLMSHRVAHFLGWERQDRHFALLAGMLHDCGVSSTATHKKLVDAIEWKGAQEHCLRGSSFLNGFAPFAQYSEAVKYHHSRWVELPSELDERTRQLANLIFLVDRLDVVRGNFLMSNPPHEALRQRQAMMDTLRPHVGLLFAADLFEALGQAVVKDSFWLELEDEFLDGAIFETLSFWDHGAFLTFKDLLSLGEMISHIVDAKSPFTHYHSLRVADLTYQVGGLMGFPEERRQMLRLAGLMHDIGKLRTPDEILEKPGCLSESEHFLVTRHPMDSKLVLEALFPETPISRWASCHHEKLNGSGYPFGWTAERIDTETRILTICDIFQALCQERPYRGRLPAAKVIAIMAQMRDDGEIDPDIFAVLERNTDPLYELSIQGGSYTSSGI